MSRPFPPRPSSPGHSFIRVNGKIRAREVRVIGVDGNQVGILTLGEAINMARQHGVDLVEIAASATPPVCRLVDYGKFRYEQSKKDKEAKKHQHANKVKEIQLSAHIDPHDFGVKVNHGIDFLCDDMKVKVSLRFRGREMAHTEFGFQIIERFTKDLTPYGHPDAPPKLIGRSINVMYSPLPRNKRAPHPGHKQGDGPAPVEGDKPAKPAPLISVQPPTQPGAAPEKSGGFSNSPFSNVNAKGNS